MSMNSVSLKLKETVRLIVTENKKHEELKILSFDETQSLL